MGLLELRSWSSSEATFLQYFVFIPQKPVSHMPFPVFMLLNFKVTTYFYISILTVPFSPRDIILAVEQHQQKRLLSYLVRYHLETVCTHV